MKDNKICSAIFIYTRPDLGPARFGWFLNLQEKLGALHDSFVLSLSLSLSFSLSLFLHCFAILINEKQFGAKTQNSGEELHRISSGDRITCMF